ncbi:NDP-sugar synthase [bacterium]|nr:NDP-sugar synthase [bacterium]
MKNVTKAMIMAAGVGSRLDPLTKDTPKPLVPILNRPVMDILLNSLSKIGINSVIANTYYLADKIIDRYKNNNFGIDFNYIKESTLSGTAGGLKKCQYFFNKGETFIVLSGDGLSNADIKKGIDIHLKSDAIATIGIKSVDYNQVSNFGVVVTDKFGYITEFQEKPSLKEAKSNFINTGIYIFNYKIFDYIPENTFFDFAKDVFPKLLCNHSINTFIIDEYWSDIGTLQQYSQSTLDVFAGGCDIGINVNENLISESNIPENTVISGYAVVGKNCKIGKNVALKNSIIWNNVDIEDDVILENVIVGNNTKVANNLKNTVVSH